MQPFDNYFVAFLRSSSVFSDLNNVYWLKSCNNQLQVLKQYFTNIATIQNMGYYKIFDTGNLLQSPANLQQARSACICETRLLW